MQEVVESSKYRVKKENKNYIKAKDQIFKVNNFKKGSVPIWVLWNLNWLALKWETWLPELDNKIRCILYLTDWWLH